MADASGCAPEGFDGGEAYRPREASAALQGAILGGVVGGGLGALVGFMGENLVGENLHAGEATLYGGLIGLGVGAGVGALIGWAIDRRSDE
jgi:hypothetical protein